MQGKLRCNEPSNAESRKNAEIAKSITDATMAKKANIEK